MRSTPRQFNSIGGIVSFLTVLSIIATGIAIADHNPNHGKGKGGGGGEPPPPPPPPAADPAIAFIAGSNNVLAVMNDDGSNIFGLLSNAMMPAWSPDLDGDPTNGYQGTIAFNRSSSSDGIWLVDVVMIDGIPTPLRIRQVFASGSGGFAPSWSPDLDPDTPGYQGMLAFGTDNGIESLAIEWDGFADDHSTVHAAATEVLVLWGDVLPLMPSWSPQGDRMAFIGLGPGLQWDLRIVDDLNDPENSQRVLATQTQVGGDVLDQAWSNSSNTIAFTGGGSLWTVDADDPENTLINLGVGGRWPAWSPDDSAIVYHVFAKPGNTAKIRKIDLASGQVTTLVGDSKTHYRFPHWRPF